jgi:O-antigen ligase
MKFVVIACLLVVGWIAGRALQARPRALMVLVFALGFLIFFNDISISAGYVPGYRGTDRGFNISLCDFAAYLLYFAAPPGTRPAPFRGVRYAYLAVCAASLALAPMPLYAAFSLWSLLRAYMMIDGLSRAFEDVRVIPKLYQGLGAGVIYQLGVCLVQRYLQGYYQVHGTFAHQNSMGMAAYLVAALLFPVVLSGNGGRFAIAALGSATLVVIFSLSRGCMSALPVIFGVIFVCSAVRRMNVRKALVLVAGAAAAAILLAVCLDSILARFANAPPRSAESRVIFEAVAKAILDDHPAGIGFNQFPFVAVVGGYHRVAEAMDAGWVDPDAVVHNVYWLTLAELGFFGFIVYMALIGHPILTALKGAWRRREEFRGELLLGCFVGLLVFCYHGRLEWVARQERNQDLFWIISVLAASLCGRPREDARAPAQAA